MADLADIITGLEAVDGMADTVTALREYAASLDTLKGDALAAKKLADKAESKRAALEADLAAARSGQTEEAAKHLAARDEAIARAATLEGAIRSRDIRDGARSLFEGQGLTGAALSDAVKLYTADLPEGVDLDGGKLIGAEASVKAFIETRPHLAARPAGHGGGSPAADPRPTQQRGGKPTEADVVAIHKERLRAVAGGAAKAK